ncbi:regulator of chromosome condensation 1/beta-lactamase-inhibitor protein II [Chytriomyces sp. MP71]|nr:regulator of chromosome condensation 1/beta-lactamase-inhibitor protein II [Chytriomyces sp. MP71]
MSVRKLVGQFLRSSVGIGGHRAKSAAEKAPIVPAASVLQMPIFRTETVAFGNGGDGKLGHGHSDNKRADSPDAKVVFFSGASLRSIAVGVSHSAAIVLEPLEDGTVLASGVPVESRTPANPSTPALIGTLYGWGSNFYGQAGFGTTDQKMGSAAFFTSDDSADLDSVEVPCKLKLLVPQGVTVDMRKVACGDFHSAALASDGTLWTWGAGCLGRKEELYDSNAILVDFFPARKRRVADVCAAGIITVALAEPIPNTAADSGDREPEANAMEGTDAGSAAREVYIWGYFEDPTTSLMSTGERIIRKSTTPLLIADALSLGRVSLVACGAAGSALAVVGQELSGNSHEVVRVYGAFSSVAGRRSDFEMPMYPVFHEMQNMDQIYPYGPVGIVDVHGSSVTDVVLFRDLGLIVKQDGTVEAFTAPLPASSNSLGDIPAPKLPSTTISFGSGKLVEKISVNSFGMFVVFKNGGETRYWSFAPERPATHAQDVLEGVSTDENDVRAGDVLALLAREEQGVLVFANGGQLVASGWNHGIAHQNLEDHIQ